MLMASKLLSSQVQGFQFFLIILSTCASLPNVQSARAALILSTRNEVITGHTADDSGTGGLSKITIVGIGFGMCACLSSHSLVADKTDAVYAQSACSPSFSVFTGSRSDALLRPVREQEKMQRMR